MTDNVIDFAKAKEDANRDRSVHIVSLDLYMNADNSAVWAAVSNVGQQDIDASWHTFIAGLLRQLAWISDHMASDKMGEGHAPIAAVSLFEDSRISTRWNDELVTGPAHVQWIRDQLMSGADEIEATHQHRGERDE